MADASQFEVVPSPSNWSAPMVNFGALGQQQSAQQQPGVPATQQAQQQNAQQNQMNQLANQFAQALRKFQAQQQQPAGASTAISPMPQTFNPNQASGLY